MNSLLTALGVMLASTSGPVPAVMTWEQAVLATSPIALWRFNEAAAPYADTVTGANSLSIGAGSTSSIRGMHPSTGNAAVWGTTGTYLNPANSAPFRLTGDMTMACCFLLTTLPTAGNSTVLAQCSATGGGETEATNAVWVYSIQNNAGATRIRCLHESGAGVNDDVTIDFPFVVNVAYQVIVVRDTVAKIYTAWVNGELAGSVSYVNNPSGGTTATLHVGSDVGISGGSANNTLRGRMDELAIWNRKLSSAEVASLRAGLLYKMDAQTDDFSTDTTALYTQSADAAGTWAVSGGKMVATGGQQALLLRNGLYSDRISCKMTRADDAGLVLRYQDASNYYVLVICDGSSSNATNPNAVVMYKRVSGSYSLIGPSTAISFVRGVENNFDFIAIGSRLIVKHNGVVVMQVTDTSLPNTGRAGMRNHLSATPSVAEFTEFTWRAVDPSFGSVVFLTHMDGSTLRDEVGHTITAFGGAGITTVDPKFGDGCTDFNGVLDSYIESTSSDFQIGASQSFTIEFWRKAGVRTLQENYMECNGARGTNPTGRWQIYHANSSDAPTFWSSGTSNLLTMSLLFPRDGQYHHEAWSRNANSLRAFLDGAAAGSTTAGLELNQSNLRWGTFENPTPVDQTYDEIRITKGVSRYDAGFARPSIPFPNGAHA